MIDRSRGDPALHALHARKLRHAEALVHHVHAHQDMACDSWPVCVGPAFERAVGAMTVEQLADVAGSLALLVAERDQRIAELSDQMVTVFAAQLEAANGPCPPDSLEDLLDDDGGGGGPP